MKTLFVSDLDGTLLAPDARLSAETVRMLNEAISRGALFSVATARTPSTVATLLKEVNTNLPLIVMTGSAVWNRGSGHYSRIRTIRPDVAQKIMDVIKDYEIPSFIYTISDNVIDIYHYGQLSEEEIQFVAERDGTPYKRFHISDSHSCDSGSPDTPIPHNLDNVILIYSMHPSPFKEIAYRRMRELEGCNPIFYHDVYGPDAGILEIFSDQASKASAVKWLRQLTGADRVVVFGDNLNDLPMMKAADVAVAVGNALPEVKEVADIVIGPNSDDSVARFILDNSPLTTQ